MKHRTGLRLLAVAVPLIGLVLVWRSGQRARDEADIHEVALRCVIGLESQATRRIFVSIQGRDPSTMFLRRFDGFEPVVLPASASRTSTESEKKALFDIKGPRWGSTEQAVVTVVRSPYYSLIEINVDLQRQGRQWRVVRFDG